MRSRRIAALALALALTACTSGTGPPSSGDASSSAPLRGGTLHLVSLLDNRTTAEWDPASYVYGGRVELVVSYDYDAAVGLPAFDRIALAPGTS
jgi:ABC-type glycerol-3-phosphate transport system substrate-binding protein